MPLDRLFPADRLEQMRAHIRSVADSHGAGDIKVGERLSNTRRALAISELARDEGRLDAFREAAMVAYWQGGANLESDEDLRAIATEAGLDPYAALAASDDSSLLARVDAIREEAGRAGVTAVPTLLLDSGQALVGARPFDALASFVESAGATRR